MALPAPEPGLVIRYGFLWFGDHASGRQEGRKDRPCAVILRNFSDHGEQIVTVLPITHSAPGNLEEAIELPFKVKQHLGLDSDRSWVILSEVNRFVWPGPDLRPVPPVESGRFDFGHPPPRLFRTLRDQFLACARAQKPRTVWRDA